MKPSKWLQKTLFWLVFPVWLLMPIIGWIAIYVAAKNIWGIKSVCPKCGYPAHYFKGAAGHTCRACKTRLIIREGKLFIP